MRDFSLQGKIEEAGTPPSADTSTPAAIRLRRLYSTLLSAYGPQQWWPAQTAFEVVIGAYLTQNTSWRGVERSIANLRQHSALTVEGIRATPEEELRVLIRPSGYMVRKAAALKAFVAMLDANYCGSLDTLRSETTLIARASLLALPGVGEETADAILLYALGHPVFVVDEYFRRVATRHGLIAAGPPAFRARYGDLQQLVQSSFVSDFRSGHAEGLKGIEHREGIEHRDKDSGGDHGGKEALVQHYNEFHALIVEVGKRHCGPRPRCEACPLAADLISPTPHT